MLYWEGNGPYGAADQLAEKAVTNVKRPHARVEVLIERIKYIYFPGMEIRFTYVLVHVSKTVFTITACYLTLKRRHAPCRRLQICRAVAEDGIWRL
jgi:hypothetical protein